jgi:hypothetical protein
LRYYLSRIGNYFTIIYLIVGIANGYQQAAYDAFLFQCKFLICQIMLQMIVRTFNLLKIFKKYTYLTIMLSRVFSDLIGFGMLFGILVFKISLILAVLCYQNQNQPGPYKEKWDEEMNKPWREEPMEG